MLEGATHPVDVPYAIAEFIVAVVSVVGNALVIIAFFREKRLRRRINYYIFSLAVADLLVGLFAIPFAILASIGLPRDFHLCVFTISFLIMLCMVSIISLVAVSADRYWAIIYPMGYTRNVRTRTTITVISFCWILGFVVGLFPLMGWNAGDPGHCFFVKIMDRNYLIFLNLGGILLPGLLLLASYSHIFHVVRRQIRLIAPMKPESRHDKLQALTSSQRREVKAAKNLSIIVLFFMLCWLPLTLMNCVMLFCSYCSIPLPVVNFCIVLSHFNSAGNPILYAYNLRDFRKAMLDIVYPCREPSEYQGETSTGGVQVSPALSNQCMQNGESNQDDCESRKLSPSPSLLQVPMNTYSCQGKNYNAEDCVNL